MRCMLLFFRTVQSCVEVTFLKLAAIRLSFSRSTHKVYSRICFRQVKSQMRFYLNAYTSKGKRFFYCFEIFHSWDFYTKDLNIIKTTNVSKKQIFYSKNLEKIREINDFSDCITGKASLSSPFY